MTGGRIVPNYAWNQDLATGNAVIDNQHKQLFTAVNTLFNAYKSGKERQEVERTIEFLMGYSIKHFADEEKLQQEYDYPEYPRHRQIHDEFKVEVKELVEMLIQEGSTDEFVNKVYVTIGEWLVNHIKGEDFKMAAYVQSKMLMGKRQSA